MKRIGIRNGTSWIEEHEDGSVSESPIVEQSRLPRKAHSNSNSVALEKGSIEGEDSESVCH